MKTISTSFQTELEQNVVALALLVTLTRTDGARVFMTNHDAPISFEGITYRNDLSFTISAIRSDSTLASDNVTIDLGLDGEVFVRSEFREGRWKKCSIEIAHVNWLNPALGKITMRRGLSRMVELRGNETARIEADGLLKVLDFTVGRTYTPACTAEFGDKKCKVALDFSQHRAAINPYGIGDWVYWYDEAEMDAQTITNGLFDADGDRSSAQAITGWTKSNGADFVVDDGGSFVVPHYDGLRVLAGTTSTGSIPEEQYVTQDLTIGASTTDIDAGKVMFALLVETAMKSSLTDFAKLRIDMLDTNGDLLTSENTGWYTLDTFDAWREKALVMHTPVGARTARVFLMTRRLVGSVANVSFARVRPFYWDFTTQDPTHGVIFKAGNVAPTDSTTQAVTWRLPTNPGFEINGAQALSATPTITGWTVTAGRFKTANTYGGRVARGSFALWSDDAYPNSKIVSRIALADYPGAYDPTDLAATNIRFQWQGWFIAATTNDFTVRIRRYDDDGVTLLGTTTKAIVNLQGAVSQYVSFSATLEPQTAFIDVEVEFIGNGSGQNRLGLDDVRFKFDSLAPRRLPAGEKVSPLLTGEDDTVPTYTTAAITADGDITWVARTSHARFDVVASVTDRKEFYATVMAGAAGDFTSTKIVWLSGANAGVENIIRIFDSGSKRVKMYFPNPAAIQVGDRFMYTQGCQKRFTEDCKTRFDNGINFRGFPYVPGNVGLS